MVEESQPLRPRGLPRWARIVLIAGVMLIAGGLGFYAYRHSTQPKTLTIAAGSFEGDAVKLVSAIAARLAVVKAPVRLKLVEKTSVMDATAAFSAGQVDLAVTRADVGNLSSARAVVLLTNAAVLIVTPPGASVEGLSDLKGKVIGVIDEALNKSIVAAISNDVPGLRFKGLTFEEAKAAVQRKEVQAVLTVTPVTEKYLTMMRSIFPPRGKASPQLVAIESAGAIAAIHKEYESYDLPKGTVRGAPPVPDEDLTTLRVSFHLVAKKGLDTDVVASLTKSIMEARRDLLAEQPLLSQLAAPSTDKDALIPIHPGASTYFEGEQKSFFDKYGDYFFYGPMFLGFLASALAAGRRFIVSDPTPDREESFTQFFQLREKMAAATTLAELETIEQQVDAILEQHLRSSKDSESASEDAPMLSLAVQRLQYLADRRRRELTDGERSRERTTTLRPIASEQSVGAVERLSS